MGHHSRHHRSRHSPSYDDDSDSSDDHRSNYTHRSHKSHKSSGSRHSRAEPPPSYHEKEDDYDYEIPRPGLTKNRPELTRSLSEDSYRNLVGQKQNKELARGRERSSHRSRSRHSRHYDTSDDDDDDYYYYDKYGHPHRRSESASRSRSRSHDRHSRDKKHHRHSTAGPIDSLESFSKGPLTQFSNLVNQPLDGVNHIVEDVLAAFGLVTASQVKQYHAEKNGTAKPKSKSRSRGRGSDSDSEEEEHERPSTRAPADHKALMRAAASAAIVEAWRTRGDYGHRLEFNQERLTRIATAAIAAGGIDAIVHKSSDIHNGQTRKHIESVLTGLKTSSAFGHRIRRRHGLPLDKQIKFKAMNQVATKLLDAGFGPKDTRLSPSNPTLHSQNRLEALVRQYTSRA